MKQAKKEPAQVTLDGLKNGDNLLSREAVSSADWA